MPLGDHIEELRARVARSLLVVLTAFIAAWVVREPVLAVLVRPHVQATEAFQLESTLKFRTYLEPITAQLKACLIVSLIVTAPFLLYQMWAFVAPGLYRRERHFLLRVGGVSVLCFAAGVTFGYFLFIPIALRFLLAMSGAQTEPVLMIGSYLSLLFVMTFALGVVFQTPLVVYHLVRWGIVEAETIQKHRKAAILTAFVLAAFFTPPDPFTQIMMAVPLIMLYDLGALAASPGRGTFGNFARFAGTIALVVAVIAALFFLWPVGHVQALKGTVQSGQEPLPIGQATWVRRGRVYRAEDAALVRVDFAKGAPQASVLIAGPARFQVHGAWKMSLYAGRALADNTRHAPLEVRTRPARVTLQSGRAEFICSDPQTLIVNVISGQAEARAEGRITRILAGRSASFHFGGVPREDTQVEQRWQELLRAAQPPD